MLTSLVQVLSGEAIAFLLRFLRTMLFAALTTVEDFGVAALFALIVVGVASLSEFGLQQLMVQRREAPDPPFQASIQGLAAIRGALSGGVLFAAAGMIADFFATPDAADPIRALALSVALTGLLHFDVYRLQRERRFLPFAVTFSAPVVISTLMIWPFFLWFGDFRAMVAALMLEQILIVLTSHVMAARRYQIRFDRSVAETGFRFGWPLLLNTIALFFVMQGEKIIVAREMGPTTLGLFAMGLTLTVSPGLLLARSAHTLLLPQLSAARDNPSHIGPLSIAAMEAGFFNAVVSAAAAMGAGPLFLSLAFGEKFNDLVPLLPLFSLVVLTRMLKYGPSMIAVAYGQTANPIIGNLGRLAALPIAWWAAASGYGVGVVLAIAAAAEAFGFLSALALMLRRIDISLYSLLPGLACVSTVVTALLLSSSGYAFAPSTEVSGSAAWLFLPMLLSVLTLRHLRGFCVRLLITRKGR